MPRYILVIGLVLCCCSNNNQFNDFNIQNVITEKIEYDQYLINRPSGLHRLKGFTESDSSLGIILVHGYYPNNWPTKGYEWTSALKVLSESERPIWWFRHDWNSCPEITREILYNALDSLTKKNEHIDSVYILGHSLGGLIVTDLAENWNLNIKASVHAIAAPLGALSHRANDCVTNGKTEYSFSENIRYYQWKTNHQLDGAFKNLLVNPQDVKLTGGNQILLPKEWEKKRLGHNLSIQLVVDQLVKKINLFSN